MMLILDFVSNSMTPTIVINPITGRPLLGLGSPGGTRIPGQTMNVLYDVLLYGATLKQAVDMVCLLELFSWYDSLHDANLVFVW